MNPAFSVIFLTTLIGAGQGLFLALYHGRARCAVRSAAGTDSRRFSSPARLLVLCSAWACSPPSSTSATPSAPGARPRMWRTSWLSREVIVLPAFMGGVFLYGVAHFDWKPAVLTLPDGLAVDASLCWAAWRCWPRAVRLHRR